MDHTLIWLTILITLYSHDAEYPETF